MLNPFLDATQYDIKSKNWKKIMIGGQAFFRTSF
jgi:hypothetical protein